MFFRQPKATDVRAAAWATAVAKLGLVEVDDGHGLLDRLIGPDSDLLTAGVWCVAGDAPPEVYVFERRAGPTAQPVASCLLTVPGTLASVPLRVTRRLRAQLATLQASATQASLVVTGDDAFDEAVTVVARESVRANGMLTPAVRMALGRLVQRGERAPVLVISESTLLASTALEEPAGIELLVTDVMGVYAALVASGSG